MVSRKKEVVIGFIFVVMICGLFWSVETNPLSLGSKPMTAYTIAGKDAGLYLGSSGNSISGLVSGTQYFVNVTYNSALTETYVLQYEIGSTWYTLTVNSQSAGKYGWVFTYQTDWVAFNLSSTTDYTSGLPQRPPSFV